MKDNNIKWVKMTELNEKKVQNYELWSNKELEYISKVDLSTPLEDDEDYSEW